jgi:hypothetical protein
MSALGSGEALLGQLFNRARAAALPWWVKWAALLVLLAAVYGLGRLQEARHGADALLSYLSKQMTQTVRINKQQADVVTVVQTKYVDRIQKIYVQGATLEVDIPKYIKPADDQLFAVNAGFVRVVAAAWSGDATGPASDSDREPAGVPLDQVAAVEVHNATSCRAWRKQALGWREFYAGQQVAINGKAGAWAEDLADQELTSH